MKNSETKARKSPRFGILDVVIILVIIIAVVGVYFRYNIINFFTGEQNLKEYIVSYSIENIRQSTVDFFVIGNEVYFASDNEKLGVLTNVSENMGAISYTPASELFTKSNGEIVEIVYPNTNNSSRVDAQGRLICTGRYSDNGSFLVNGTTHIASGQYIDVKTDYLSVTIRIDEILLVEEN